ncbi:MAG: putative sigma-54 modulation protein [Patescibacteria group bacterium]|jgi:ribosomal subunit interface protein|nr:putative sigma-54 modulation protein [Patescibacteria group bacterium]
MNVNIKATNIELTDAIRDYVHSKISALGKIIGDEEGVNIFIEIGKESNHHNKGEDVYMCEARMRFMAKDYYVKNFNSDLYAAVDATKDDVLRDVNSDKKRGETLFRRGARSLKKRIKGMKPWWPFGGKN